MFTFESMISELLHKDQKAIDAYFSCYQNAVGRSIKIIQKKIKVEEFLTLGSQYWRDLQRQTFTADKDVYYITRDDHTSWLGKHRLHNSGFFYIQEVAASLPVQFLPVLPWDIVLDMCSAPWGKAVQISDKWWYVVSNEVNWSRIVPLQYNLNRIWVYNSTVTSIQWGLWWNAMPNFFDHILVDAPCSGEGTWFKSDDWIKWWREENVHKIAHLQKDLLSSAIKACKPWWTIIYSTCTINPRENEAVVSYALNTFQNMITLEEVSMKDKSPGVTHWEDKELLSDDDAKKVARFWPHIQQTWWFFIAKFTKNIVDTDEEQKVQKDHSTPSQLDISNALQEKVSELLLHDYWIKIDPKKYLFISSQKQIYLTTPQYLKIHWKIFTEKTWVPVFKRNKEELIPLHGLWNCLWHIATKNVLTLPPDILQKYSEHHDVQVENDWWSVTNENKFVILRYKEYWFSVGKIVDGYIKNKFIK